MLRITLYKNCILNETYQEVISTGEYDNTSILEKYLATLSSYSINDLDEVYYKNTGILNFDLELINETNIYEYNYMKIRYYDEEENLKLIRYCFIQDIKINNDIVQLYYTEDIFSSYANKINKITKSYLSRGRIVNKYSNVHIFNLPVEYDGNNILDLDFEFTEKYCILVNIQYYESSTFGNSTTRLYKTFLLGNLIFDENDNPTFEYKLNSEDVFKKLSDLVSKQSSNVFRTEWGGNAYYYEVGDIYIVPNDFIYRYWFENFDDSQGRPNYRIITSQNEQIALAPVFQQNIGKRLSYFDKTYTNNFKRLSVGTYNNQIPVINNGTNVYLIIYFMFDNNNITITMHLLNQIIDISKDFMYQMPFTEINGETNALHRMTRVLSNVSSVFDLAVGVATGGVGVANNINKINGLNRQINRIGKRTSNGIMASNSQLDKINDLDELIDKTKLIGLGEFAFGGSKAIKGITSLIENNLPYYTTNKGTFAKSSGFINATLGIIDISIDSDNDNLVTESINNTGYVLYEYINDLSYVLFNNPSAIRSYNINYDIIKFDTINVIGDFPRSIALQLNDIFKNGFKIWYNENLQEDGWNINV